MPFHEFNKSPNAVSCHGSIQALAFEAYYTLRELGLKIPEDVAIAGVDDLSSYATYPVRLTSAGYDINAMAEQAVDLLFEKIEHKRKNANTGKVWQQRFLLSQYLAPGSTT